MKICITIALLLLVAFFSLDELAKAQPIDIRNTPFLILSEGASTCGEYVAEPAARVTRMEWVLGYITGRNRETAVEHDRMIGKTFDRPEAVVIWLLEYCKSHSLDRLVKAADNLRAEFEKREQGH